MESVVSCNIDKNETELKDTPRTQKRLKTGNELLLAAMIT